MTAPAAQCPWHRRVRQHLGHSIKWRIVVVFVLLATAVAGVFVFGAQRACAVGWRDAARPLLADYVAHLASEVTGGGPTPQLARAQALVQRLPVSLHISGPVLNWDSEPARHTDGEAHTAWTQAFNQRTADGHTLRFGIQASAVERRPRYFGMALFALLVVPMLAWLYLRRLLRPLDAIGAGAQRFGTGDFSQPIPVRHPGRPDELGQLANTINTMGQDISQMLDAKRALLLAISHELRSPLTRARLNAELLPEEGAAGPQRAALLRDLQEMGSLISDLLESERLASQHAALQRESTDLLALASSVLEDLRARHPQAAQVRFEAPADLPAWSVDAARLRLLLRNLLDNALRHGAEAPQPPTLRIARSGNGLVLTVRDHGPGVPDAQLQHLAQAFYRPDSARTRAAGGVGLGLYLCRLVAVAHGGSLVLRNAEPGLEAVVRL